MNVTSPPGEDRLNERDIIDRVRRMASHPAARNLDDDAALFEGLVITHDSIAEGVHYLPGDPPETVGWKLAAVNASDLAGKGARPEAALLSLAIRGDGAWEAAFLDGLEQALAEFGMALIGGDTIALPHGSPRVLGLTALGRAGPKTPARSGGKVGDTLWLAGTVGDAAAGLEQLRKEPGSSGALVEAYRRPRPLIAEGQALAPLVDAMMDVSDGLLIDAGRMAAASGLRVAIDLSALPLSQAFREARGDGLEDRLFAATGGDDYALLASGTKQMLGISLPAETRLTAIGRLVEGEGLSLNHDGAEMRVPERQGYEHRT
ncbi:thiamine-phosphate kinase [Sphingomonas sp. HDW15A]|uniref:thiamine-phosphate kinase n=1 Tax=Sphingomonas sp. HDW15A TaxID=2714942 RepID=UPI0014099A23|nr:thiamine-phosphate kinase [Sphingomonas sp. HDW15A]QIK96823.1 thiamine-phosphate kinase [Sphingomonas sp. HDW15A]